MLSKTKTASGSLLKWGALLGGFSLLARVLARRSDPKPGVSVQGGRGVKVEASICIQRPASELFGYWRQIENLSRVMSHLEAVHDFGEHSHWVVKAPLGFSIEWDAEIINEHENELLAWRSINGSQLDNAGSVRFVEVPGSGETEVKVSLKYDPPGGGLGVKLARFLGRDIEKEINEDLAQFKQRMEQTPFIEFEEPHSSLQSRVR
jgi:uncharacterized membrane protein